MKKKILFAFAVVILSLTFGFAATTAINLATQVSGILAASHGGLGSDNSAVANGKIPIGNGSGFTIATLTQGTGITITNGVGTITVAASNGAVPNFADNETPSGTINGSNVTFTVANTPSPATSLNCYRNGIQQRASGNDFTLSVATITYGTAPATGDTLVCSYRY